MKLYTLPSIHLGTMFERYSRKIAALLIVVSAVLMINCVQESQEKPEANNRALIIDGEPYFIKGICYHPVAKGETKRDFSPLEGDLSLMKEAGINTIRVYEPIQEEWVLDALAEAGIKVIVGFGYNQNGEYDILSGTFIDYVSMYKDHPAILMWELGNEYNYHPEWFDNDINNWYTALNESAAKIHEVDQDHPVATAHGEIPSEEILALVPNVDVWGMNVYRWDNPEEIYEEWKERSDKPMYLAEAGADSYMTIENHGYAEGVNEQAQVDAVTNILEDVLANKEIGAGVTVFQFTDGLWKAGNPETQDKGGWAPNSTGVPYDGTPNEEYWGIVDIDRNKKPVYDVVKEAFTRD